MGGFGFGRLWEAFEKPWGAFGGCGLSLVCPSPRLWEAFFARLWDAGKALGAFWMFWDALVGSLALVQGMLWKVLAALGVFERYGRLLEDFRKL